MFCRHVFGNISGRFRGISRFFGNFAGPRPREISEALNYKRTVKSILLIKKFLGLAEMTFGLVYAALSLPEWQAVKITFSSPCCLREIEIICLFVLCFLHLPTTYLFLLLFYLKKIDIIKILYNTEK